MTQTVPIETSSGQRPNIDLRTRNLIVVAIIAVAACGLVLFSSSGVDDTFITYGAARALATTGKILNWNGQAVEQSSSLFLVLWLAGWFKLTHVDLTTLGGLSSVLFGCGALVLLGRLGERVARSLGGYVAVLTATTFPFLLWCYSGMEQSAYVFLVAAFFLFFDNLVLSPKSTNRWLGQALVSACLVTVRPEATLLMLLVLGALAVLRLRSRVDLPITTVLGTMAVVIACAVGVAIYRKLVFGLWFPLPVIAKAVSLDREHLSDGLSYLVWGPSSIVVLVTSVGGVMLTLVAAVRGRISVVLALSASFVAGQLSFVALVGGDWMPGGRFLVPLVPFMVISWCGAVRPRVAAVSAAILCVINVATLSISAQLAPGRPFWKSSTTEPQSGSLPWFVRFNYIYVRDYFFAQKLRVLVDRISATHHRPVNMLTEHAGAVMYWLTERDAEKIHVVDRHGITTRDFTDCVLTKDLRRYSVGIDVTWPYVLDNFGPLSDRCGIATPDFIHELDKDDTPELSWKRAIDIGYRLVAHAEPDTIGLAESALVSQAVWPAVADIVEPAR